MTFYVLQQRGVGMSEPLVDKDGYPRNDIDVYSVRKARHDINCKITIRVIYIVYIHVHEQCILKVNCTCGILVHFHNKIIFSIPCIK
jgi:hypothetical protein